MTVAATWMRIARVKIMANVLRRFGLEALEGSGFRTMETRIAERAGLKLPTWSMKLERCSLRGVAIGVGTMRSMRLRTLRRRMI